MNTSNIPPFLGASAPTPPESPLNFTDLPLDLTASNSSSSSSTYSAYAPSYSPAPSTSSRQNRRSVPIDQQDAAYRVRRNKNNIAAKKSRDLRRAREAATAEKAQMLESLVLVLQTENKNLKKEIERLTRVRMTIP